jgi:2-polyprenyl-6-methoxyphenol hydroxylase-like FAD-dependent oxidoreductase
MLACELGLAGVRAVVLERDVRPQEQPKANGLVGQIARAITLRGFLDEAPELRPLATPRFNFGPLALDLGILGESPLHILPVPQHRLAALLAAKAAERGADIRTGHEVLGIDEAPDQVTLRTSGPEGAHALTARYVVGCDGAHSMVRKHAGIGFPGVTSDYISRMARVILPASAVSAVNGGLDVAGAGRFQAFAPNLLPAGAFSIAPAAALDPAADPNLYIISTRERRGDADADDDGDLTLGGLQASLRRVIGAELPIDEAPWLGTTVGNSRQATAYRSGRLFLAGDAAHIFSAGGSALNTGMLDALNLGWKLAGQVQGWAAPGLLDSYESERAAAGRRTLLQTRAQAALSGTDANTEALRQLLGELLRFPEPLRLVADAMEGRDVRHGGSPAASPLVGRWAPDVLAGDSLGGIMRAGRGTLLDFTPDSALSMAAEAWQGRVDIVRRTGGPGITGAGSGLLVRPDGYIAWAGDAGASSSGLREALATWFGAL